MVLSIETIGTMPVNTVLTGTATNGTFKTQIHQDKINFAVEELLVNMVQNGKIRSALNGKIEASVDIDTLEVEAGSIRKHIKKLTGAKDKLGEQIDRLDVTDRHYEAKYDDMQKRLESLYDEIDLANKTLKDKLLQISRVREQHMSSQQVYDYLSVFDIIYKDFTDAEKKAFLQSFIKEIQIYPEPQKDGRILKSIELNIPVYFNGQQTRYLFPKSENTDESVVLMSRGW